MTLKKSTQRMRMFKYATCIRNASIFCKTLKDINLEGNFMKLFFLNDSHDIHKINPFGTN